MPSEVKHFIGSVSAWSALSGPEQAAYAGAYTSVSAWEAAQQGDFVTADEVHIGEVANEAIAESSLLFLGSTTDATRKWVLRAAAGAEPAGIPGAGARVTFSTTSAALTVRDFLDIEDIELIGSASSTNVIVSAHPFENVSTNLRRCIVNGNGCTHSSNHGFDSRNRVVTDTIESTLFLDLGGFSIAGFYSSPTVDIYNSGAANCNLSDDANRGGFHSGQAKYTYTNCWALDCGSTNQADFYSTGATLVNCASSDTTAHGTSPVTGISSADFVNSASNDFHLSASSNLIGAGANLTGTLSTDVDGDSWPGAGAWDIGFDYYISSGVTITGTPQLQSLNATGALEISDTINGSPQLQALLSSGTITISDTITGTPQLQALTAAGSIQFGNTATITGTPQLQSLPATGQVDISDRITGNPQLQALLSSGTITISDTITGTPQLQALTAAGSIDVFGTVTITGTPQLQSLTAAGTITAVVDAVQIIASTQHIETTLASAQHITRTITQTGYLS